MRRAFSLIEALAAAAIVAVALGGGVLILLRLTRAEEAIGQRLSADAARSRVLSRLRRDFERARSLSIQRFDPRPGVDVIDLTDSAAITNPAPPVTARPLYLVTLELPEATVEWRTVAVWPEDLDAHLQRRRDNPSYAPPPPGNTTRDQRIPRPRNPDSGQASRAATPILLLERRLRAPGGEPPGGWSPAWATSGFRPPTPPSSGPTEYRRFPEEWENWETAAGADQSLVSFVISGIDSDGREKTLPSGAANPADFGSVTRTGILVDALGFLTLSGLSTAPNIGDLVALSGAPPADWGELGPGSYRVIEVEDLGSQNYRLRLDLEGRRAPTPAPSFTARLMTAIPELRLGLEFQRALETGASQSTASRIPIRGRRTGDLR